MPEHAQAMLALERANAIRLARAAFLRPLRTGQLRIGDVDLDDPSIQSMLVVDLLANLRFKRGGVPSSRTVKPPARIKASRLVQTAGCLPRTRIGSLTPARKRALVALVEASVPAQAPPSPIHPDYSMED